MDKLKMMSLNKTQENIEKIRTLFPNAVTEVKKDGKTTLAVDFDVLKQEMSGILIDSKEERYQMTWPDKKKSILLANTPITATLRPCKEESVDFDHTQNLYIEGDNLDVLKLLQETYLGKIKMIYIDPPYNTGNDFVYNDDFRVESEEWSEMSGDYDEKGNRLFQNTESNGRFHTDWLNMIYPRLKVAKDLLSDDGVIFISIDDNEVDNLTKIGKEIFGEKNYINVLKWKRKKQPSFLSSHIAPVMEYVLIFAKNRENLSKLSVEKVSDNNKKVINISNAVSERIFKAGVEVKDMENGVIPKGIYTIKTMTVEYKDDIIVRNGRTINEIAVVSKFLNTQEKINEFIDKKLLFITVNKGLRRYLSAEEIDNEKAITDLILDWGDNQDSEKEQKEILGIKCFDYTKPVALLFNLIKSITKEGDMVLDFFSGSATTAHAVMQLNAEDGGNRKYIMVQLPEKCDEKSEAYKAGYKTICDIGKERIRRAGKKIKEENPSATNLDVGFRVLKLDSSNMKDVYYKSSDYEQSLLSSLENNIKEDRTPLDLLFQVMLELGKPLSAKIEENIIAHKKVFIVDGNDLIACFDENITEDVVKAIAQKKPLYAVFRDNSFSSDTVAANFEQIFATYSPNTTRKVL